MATVTSDQSPKRPAATAPASEHRDDAYWTEVGKRALQYLAQRTGAQHTKELRDGFSTWLEDSPDGLRQYEDGDDRKREIMVDQYLEKALAGSAVADTGVRRQQGFGLSTGGGSGSGSSLDVADFCCPDYLVFMVQRIRSNWDAKIDGVGEAVIKFTIQKDGRIVGPEVERSSGSRSLDDNAVRALVYTKQLPALPDAFPNPTLTVHLNFQYTR
jgi:TonB family protein